MSRVYKVVRSDAGVLTSAYIIQAWKLKYALGETTVPEKGRFPIFAFETYDQAVKFKFDQAVSSCQIYQCEAEIATCPYLGGCCNLPEGTVFCNSITFIRGDVYT